MALRRPVAGNGSAASPTGRAAADRHHRGEPARQVSLDEQTTGLEGDKFTTGGRIDLATGEFWPEIDDSYDSLDDEEDDEREWLWVERRGSRDGYRDMEAFVARIDDPTIADLLEVAISGRGAFRRFRDTLARWPALLQAWSRHRSLRTRVGTTGHADGGNRRMFGTG